MSYRKLGITLKTKGGFGNIIIIICAKKTNIALRGSVWFTQRDSDPIEWRSKGNVKFRNE